VTRAHAVIGVEGLVPYNYEVESALFISQNGDVSGRFSLRRIFWSPNDGFVQSRVENHRRGSTGERFTTGRGFEQHRYGLRLRYDISRKFGPVRWHLIRSKLLSAPPIWCDMKVATRARSVLSSEYACGAEHSLHSAAGETRRRRNGNMHCWRFGDRFRHARLACTGGP